jgi:hypothetical protein
LQPQFLQSHGSQRQPLQAAAAAVSVWFFIVFLLSRPEQRAPAANRL